MSKTSVDYVRVFAGADGQWYYESRAGNHQVLSTSEGYTRHEDALHAAQAEHPDAPVDDEAHPQEEGLFDAR